MIKIKNYDLKDRILGCLYSAGIGDAMGAPSEALSQNEILEKFGGYITEFYGPGDSLYVQGNIPGEITDDTSQMYEMAKAVVKSNGKFTINDAAKALVSWSKNYPKYYPRNAGATTRFVIGELISGKDPEQVGMTGKTYDRGTTNGAAMRVAAAGLVNPGNLDKATEMAITMSKPSHGTQHAFAGSSAIACGIAEALTQDSTVVSVIEACIYGAKKGYIIGNKEARNASGLNLLPKIFKSIKVAFDTVTMEETLQQLDALVGNDGSIQSSVASAIGIFLATKGDARKTVIYGANLGGDTDTIACIAGMLSGAFCGLSSIEKDWIEFFEDANPDLKLRELGEDLIQIANKNIK